MKIDFPASVTKILWGIFRSRISFMNNPKTKARELKIYDWSALGSKGVKTNPLTAPISSSITTPAEYWIK